MATEPFQKDSIGWQIQQLQRQLGEWWEWQLRKLQFNFPEAPKINTGDWSLFWEIIKVVSFISLALLVFWAIWRVWQLIYPSLLRQTQQLERTNNQPTTHLSIAGWLKRSQQYQQQGNYYQACYCIYMAMLQQLDEKNLIPQLSSRTDEEYRDIILQLPHPTPYETLLNIHQQLCFGDGKASPALLEECQQAYQEL